MPPILELTRLCKQYPGVVALDDVNLALERGEVRVLLGKNGAGKSTLIKILSGAIAPDSGEIHIDGQPVVMHDPQDAFKRGIATVYQEMSLVPGLTVAENITLGRWPRNRTFGIPTIDVSAIRRIAKDALNQLEVKLNLNETVSRLSVAQQQLVEIAKAISFNPRVLVLDEPSSALAAHEIGILHGIVRRLAEQGRSIIYVTHRMQEVPRIAHTVSVLRDGHNVGTIPVAEATPEQIARLMVGSDWRRRDWGYGARIGEVRLAVRHLNRVKRLKDISFEIRSGEVLGVAGLLGSGRTELMRAIFGLDPIDSGEIWVKGEHIAHPNPEVMKAHGVGFSPEDRKRQGLVMPFSVKDNLTLASLRRSSIRGILQPARESTLAQEMVERLSVKTASLDVKTQTLSGGNQQKIVLGNWLNTLPEVLLLDEPSRGIDIQAKEQIFVLMRDLAQQGLAVLFVSSEIHEVLDVSDRILIMSEGRITSEVLPGEVDHEKLLAMVMKEHVGT